MTIAPCPFCANDIVTVDEISPGVTAVACAECGCIGPHNEYGTTTDEAIAAWNQRSTA